MGDGAARGAGMRISVVVGAVVVLVGCGRSSKPKLDLGAAAVDGPSAAELAPIFELGGKSTDVQREEKEKAIKGKVVEWKGLKVYEVGKRGEACYKIQTSGTSDAPGTFVRTCPEDDATKTAIVALKTGDRIDVKGLITDVSMRNIDLDPAIVTVHVAGTMVATSAPSSPRSAGAPATPSSVATAPLFVVGKVAAKLKNGFGRRKGTYVGVDFQVTAKDKPERGTLVSVKASCKIGDERIVDTSHALGLGADTLSAGETKKGDVSFWTLEPLEKVPTTCTLSFGTEVGLHDAEMNLGEFCFTPPSTTAAGACLP
jgi:hypothetical protein